MYLISPFEKALGSFRLLLDRELSISPGDKIILLGLNGSGKTSFLKEIRTRVSGDFFYRGSQLITDFPVKVEEFLQWARSKTSFSITEAEKWMTDLQVDKLLPQEVRKLSAGEAQRVLLLESLLYPCDLRIWDETFSHCDGEWGSKIVKIIDKFAENQDFSWIHATHDSRYLRMKPNRIWVMDQGKLVLDGTREVFIQSEWARRIFPDIEFRQSSDTQISAQTIQYL